MADGVDAAVDGAEPAGARFAARSACRVEPEPEQLRAADNPALTGREPGDFVRPLHVHAAMSRAKGATRAKFAPRLPVISPRDLDRVLRRESRATTYSAGSRRRAVDDDVGLARRARRACRRARPRSAPRGGRPSGSRCCPRACRARSRSSRGSAGATARPRGTRKRPMKMFVAPVVACEISDPRRPRAACARSSARRLDELHVRHAGELAAGDVEHLAVDEVRPRRAEEEHAAGRLLGRARAAERDQHRGHPAQLVGDAELDLLAVDLHLVRARPSTPSAASRSSRTRPR